MFCKQCGTELKDGAAFCTNCGAKQNAADVPAKNAEEKYEKTICVFDAKSDDQSQQIAAKPVVEEKPPVQTPAKPVQPTPNHAQTPAKPVQTSVKPTHTAAQSGQQYAKPQNVYNSNNKAHNGKVGFGEAISLFLKNYVNFEGRASKSEYWWAFLFNILVGLISGFIPVVGGVFTLALLIPGISVAVRRLHDTGKAGSYWFMGLIPVAGGIILLIQLLKDSEGDNQWGPSPAYVGNTSVQYEAPVNTASAQKVVTDNDIYVMSQNHEPVDLSTPDAKQCMDAALGKIVPTYTGFENLAGAMMLCDPQNIKTNIVAADTDTLLVVLKALDYYIGQGVDANILGMARQNVLSALKTRF